MDAAPRGGARTTPADTDASKSICNLLHLKVAMERRGPSSAVRLEGSRLDRLDEQGGYFRKIQVRLVLR
jgi:hypothetical protein